MLILKEEHYIGEGDFQKCYVHPNNQNLCIKVKIKGNDSHNRVEKEIKYYERIQNKRSNYFEYPFLAKFYKKEETNLGTGFVYDLIRDETTNNISLTLYDYLIMDKSPYSDKLFLEHLKKLKEQLIKHKVIVRDLTGKNICCKVLKNGLIELVIVDGVGYKDIFPFVEYIGFYRRMKINKIYRKKKLNSLNELRTFFDK